MLVNIFFSFLIALLFYIEGKLKSKLKILVHPIIVTPLLGLFFGMKGFSTGVTVGVIVELIWGSNLLNYNIGLKYPLLLSLLTLLVNIFTGNISLFFNLALIVVLVFSFQEGLGWLEERDYFVILVFLFSLVVLAGLPLIKELLGFIPAEFLNDIAVSGSLLPVVGLAGFLIKNLNSEVERQNLWNYCYAIAVILSAVFLFKGYYWAILLFPLNSYLLYILWDYSRATIYSKFLKYGLFMLIIISAPLLTELNLSQEVFAGGEEKVVTTYLSYFVKGSNLELILWEEVILATAIILRIFKITAIEAYFIISILGVIGSKLGVLI